MGQPHSEAHLGLEFVTKLILMYVLGFSEAFLHPVCLIHLQVWL